MQFRKKLALAALWGILVFSSNAVFAETTVALDDFETDTVGSAPAVQAGDVGDSWTTVAGASVAEKDGAQVLSLKNNPSREYDSFFDLTAVDAAATTNQVITISIKSKWAAHWPGAGNYRFGIAAYDNAVGSPLFVAQMTEDKPRIYGEGWESAAMGYDLSRWNDVTITHNIVTGLTTLTWERSDTGEDSGSISAVANWFGDGHTKINRIKLTHDVHTTSLNYEILVDHIEMTLPAPVCDGNVPGIYIMRGDINEDCYTNLEDLKELAGRWLESGCVNPTWCDDTDIDRDANVNLTDFQLFASDFPQCTDPANSDCKPIADRLKLALFNWWQPTDELEVAANMNYDVAFLTTVQGNPSNFQFSEHERWSRAVDANGLKYMPYIWWNAAYYGIGANPDSISTLRYMGEDGVSEHAPCPLDEIYWEKQVRDGFDRIAQLRDQGDELYGIGFDLEMYYGYSPTPFAYTYSEYCYCDHCMQLFWSYQGLTDPIPSASQRYGWIISNNLMDEFHEFVYQYVKGLASDAAQAALSHDANLNFAILLYENRWWQEAIRDGFLVGRTKVLACMETISYVDGYTSAIVTQESILNQTKGVVFIPGLWLLEAEDRYYANDTMVHHIYKLARHSDGYFLGDLSRLWKDNEPGWPPSRQQDFISTVQNAHAELILKDANSQYNSPYDGYVAPLNSSSQ